MNNQPTPKEAIEMIDRAIATVVANRADHVALQQAIFVIQKFIIDASTPAPEPQKASDAS